MKGLKEKRKALKLTQAQMAEKLGIKLATYRAYEYGKREPSINFIISSEKIFGCSLVDLVQGFGDKINQILDNFKTCELCEALTKREAVEHIWVENEKKFAIVIDNKKISTEIDRGSARIFIVWD